MFTFKRPYNYIHSNYGEYLRFDSECSLETFTEILSHGYELNLYPEEFYLIKDSSAGEPSYWDRIDEEKKHRVLSDILAGTIEMPILLEDNRQLTLVSGNTRLTAMARLNHPVTVWVMYG